MALTDWLWLVRLIMEILKLISQLPEEELAAIAQLRTSDVVGEAPTRTPPSKKT